MLKDKEKKNSCDAGISGQYRIQFAGKTEPRFRRLVSDYLAKEYVTVEQRLYAVKTDKKWQWLGKLYPAVFTRDRQVLF